MKWVFAACVICLPSWGFIGPRLEDFPEKEEWRFVGCRPTVSECKYSCPSGKKFAWQVNSVQCSYDPYEPVACFCAESDYP